MRRGRFPIYKLIVEMTKKIYDGGKDEEDSRGQKQRGRENPVGKERTRNLSVFSTQHVCPSLDTIMRLKGEEMESQVKFW